MHNIAYAQGEAGGGGMYAHDTRVTLNRCEFRNNTASLGAAVHVLLADLTAIDCVFSQNLVTDFGYRPDDGFDGYGRGALYVDGALYGSSAHFEPGNGKIIIRNCAFEENRGNSKVHYSQVSICNICEDNSSHARTNSVQLTFPPSRLSPGCWNVRMPLPGWRPGQHGPD